MRLVTAHVPDRPGILAAISQVLAEAELNITAFTVDANRLRFITDTAPAAVRALDELGIAATEHRVLSIQLTDQPGRLAQISKLLAEAGINIRMAFGHAGAIYLQASDPEEAAQLLAAEQGLRH